jgi:hypothetical protein
MRTLSAIFGAVALLGALGCGGSNTASTASVTALSGGPSHLTAPPPPPMPTLRH